MRLQCVVWVRSNLFIDFQQAAQICQFIKNEAWEVSAGVYVSANVSVNEFNVHRMATTQLSVDLDGDVIRVVL